MRILTGHTTYASRLIFSDAARHLMVFNGRGKPYLEVHNLHTTEPPAVMDKHPPRPKWVVGYDDTADRPRIIPAPSERPHVWRSGCPISTDGTRGLWRDFSSDLNTCQLHACTRRGEVWRTTWTVSHNRLRHPNGSGPFLWPRCFFDGNRRFLFGWYEQLHVRNKPRYRSQLGVGDAADGRELSASAFFDGAVQLACGADSATVVAVGVQPTGRDTDRLLIFPSGAVDGESVERRTRAELKALVLDPFGRFLLSASGTKVTVWDSATWKPLHKFDWKIGNVTCLAVSDNGTVAAAGGDKGKVAVWDVG